MQQHPPVGKMYRHRDLLNGPLTREQLRRAVGRNAVARISRGMYASTTGQRPSTLEALFARLPSGTVLGYETAAASYGFGRRAGADEPVHVIVPSSAARPRIRGVVCHEAALPVTKLVMIDGIPYAPPARCAVDLARHATRPGAIALLDAALRSATCTSADLAAEVIRHDGLRGVRQARELVRIADPRPECAQESHLRLVIIDAGLPVPEPQVWVLDGTGRRAYRIDLAYRERKVGLEYDGRSHLTIERLAADRSRMNWLSARGWAMRHFTAHDLYGSPAVIVADVRAALR
jgi:hypothetical protein